MMENPTTATSIGRRTLLGSAAAAGAVLAARPARAQAKPDKLVYVGDNGPWHWTLVEEAGPEYEKATGIKVDFTLLPGDALSARLKAELFTGSSGIDIVQWTASMAGWLSPHMSDHEQLLATSAGRHPDFDWDDFLPAVRALSTYDGKLCGIPYRVTMGILHYQKALLAQVGITKAPESFAELQAAAIATTKSGAPDRYGLGYQGRQGPATIDGWAPFLRSNGGRFYDPKTFEIYINDTKGVEALEYYGDLMTKYKVVVPDSLTWESDEILAGGQNDRYAMAITTASYGALMNDPKLSKTAGRWGWAVSPGRSSKADSSTFLSGWTLGVTEKSSNKDWAFDFIQFATSKKALRRSIERGNAPPRVSVLNDPEVQAKYGWAPAAAEQLKTAQLDPRDAVWGTLELPLRVAISQVLLGQQQAKPALDAVATAWQRSLRRTVLAK
jgi:multiple sugar transport system substrate-binding protein